MGRKRSNRSERWDDTGSPDRIEGEPLEPLRIVERELTHPNGTRMRVKVPVYPPFELKKRAPAKEGRTEKVRKAS